MPLLLLFALTLFYSATLLFLVQPMIGKMLLPMLGGTPAVWNTCMVFFQAMLLAGYAYAHATTSLLGARRQAVLHLGVLLLPFLTFGLTIFTGLLDYGEGSPILGLLLALFLLVGAPFFVVSTSAPLLQKWFADTDHPAARDPYFLYAASNLGSMLALVGYPLVIEEMLKLRVPDQWLYWKIGYGILVVLTAVCAVGLWRAGARVNEEAASDKEEDPSPLTLHSAPLTLTRKLRWVVLAFVPSSLMLGATTYMTTDIAAIPSLWVLPLGLYLLSFILVFSRLPGEVHRTMVTILPFLVLVMLFLMLSDFPLRIWWKLLVHLAVLFVVAMVCHGELARDRPPTRYLTMFYLLMSVGGVLGGLFNALIAPVIFNSIVEYPLVLVLACLLIPNLEAEDSSQKSEVSDQMEQGAVGVSAKAPALSTGLMGFYFGAGVALLIPALGRSDLGLHGLTGLDGLWLAAAFVAGVGFVAILVSRKLAHRAVNWLDLGLPISLGVLALGLNLGLKITVVHHGLDKVFAYLHYTLASWDLVPIRLIGFLNPETIGPLIILVYVLPVILCSLFINRPLRFGLGVGALLLASSICGLLDKEIVLRQRSFFGALHVADDVGDDGGIYRRLHHGTTLHGVQRLRWGRAEGAAAAASFLAAPDLLGEVVLLTAGSETLRNPGREPLAYFHRTGPIGQVFAAYDRQFVGRHLGVIGLGTGTIATYAAPGQKLTYFEIDPLIKRIAFDRVGVHFTFVNDARARGVAVEDMVLGDARLKLKERADNGPPDKFALLVVDAFSSDAIPIHLLTLEALEIYLDNLADDGLLVFHISNRYLDLEPVLGNLANKLNIAGVIQTDFENGIANKASSTWVVMAKNESVLGQLVHEGRWDSWKSEQGWDDSHQAMLMLSVMPDANGVMQGQGAIGVALLEKLQAPWQKLKMRPEVGIWTDGYSNLLRVFEWKN